jgi:hypothetical protein
MLYGTVYHYYEHDRFRPFATETENGLWVVMEIVDYDRLVMALAFVFTALAVLLLVVSIVIEPFVIIVAVFFAVVAYFMWYQASGQLGNRVYQRVEERARTNNGQNERRRGGFGGGPREQWNPRSEWARRAGFSTDQWQGRQQRQRSSQNGNPMGPTTAEAYDILGLDPDADEATIKRAYRERVKEVHPDTETGSEEKFKRVNAAYEQLTEN